MDEGETVGRGRVALFGLLGVAAGLPFYLFNATLLFRLARHGVDVVTIGFFAWVALLPTFKFAWAPLVDRWRVPGFGAWGRRQGWLMLAQCGVVASLAAMALTANDASLPLTALFATLAAFWTTTLEIAADAWRIELAPSARGQGPIVAANLWGYRSAMVIASGGAIALSTLGGGERWDLAYGAMAAAALAVLLVLAALPVKRRARSLLAGLGVAAGAIVGVALLAGLVGGAGLVLWRAAGGVPAAQVPRLVLVVALAPFGLLGVLLPRLRRLPLDAPLLRSPVGAYVALFRRWGLRTLPVLAFVSMYRMGDVMALTLSHPLFVALGYRPGAVAVADTWITVPASIAGVTLGSWLAARRPLAHALAIGAGVSAVSNWAFAWLARVPPGEGALYLAMATDQFGHGFAGAVFVVYLSLLCDPRTAGAHYAFLSGFAFLLPRLLAGASGAIAAVHGYDGFFAMTGALSLAAILFLPFALKAGPSDG